MCVSFFFQGRKKKGGKKGQENGNMFLSFGMMTFQYWMLQEQLLLVLLKMRGWEGRHM